MQGQIVEMKAQLGHSDEQFFASHRPWINVSAPIKTDGPLVFDNSGAHVKIVFGLRNGGSAPAIGVNTIGGDLHVGPMPRTPELIRQLVCGAFTPSFLSNSGGA